MSAASAKPAAPSATTNNAGAKVSPRVIVFGRAEEGGYIVTFPAIPNLATQGETLDEARAMAADCLLAYLESLRKDGEPFPYEAPEGPVTESVSVDLAIA